MFIYSDFFSTSSRFDLDVQMQNSLKTLKFNYSLSHKPETWAHVHNEDLFTQLDREDQYMF